MDTQTCGCRRAAGTALALVVGVADSSSVGASAVDRVALQNPVRQVSRSALANRSRPALQLVAAERTATSPVQFREALAAAHERLHGERPSEPTLDVLAAHVAHETACGQRMYNHNFGGIKGASADGLSARYGTHEFVGSRRLGMVDGFRAYRSVEDGAEDYLRLLETRYESALDAARRGDVDGFAVALKQGRYYTAPVESYAGALRALASRGHEGGWDNLSFGVQTGRRPVHFDLPFDGAWVDDFQTTAEVARVLDTVASLAARIGSPIDSSST